MSTTTSASETNRSSGKRERILEAAVEVFARSGYSSSKVSEIAKEAGVADGTIYLYFEGKEDLLMTIFREFTRRHIDAVRKRIAGADGPEQRLRLAVQSHLETLGANRSLAVVFQVELRHSLKFMSLFSHEEFADYLALLQGIVEQGQSQEVFRTDTDPRLMAKAIFGVLDEMVTSWILSEKTYVLSDQARPVSEFVLRGLR